MHFKGTSAQGLQDGSESISSCVTSAISCTTSSLLSYRLTLGIIQNLVFEEKGVTQGFGSGCVARRNCSRVRGWKPPKHFVVQRRLALAGAGRHQSMHKPLESGADSTRRNPTLLDNLHSCAAGSRVEASNREPYSLRVVQSVRLSSYYCTGIEKKLAVGIRQVPVQTNIPALPQILLVEAGAERRACGASCARAALERAVRHPGKPTQGRWRPLL